MKMDIAIATIKAVLEQAGCPLCRLNGEFERRYVMRPRGAPSR